MRVEELNVLALAYMGDSVYEVFVRDYLLHKGICKVNDLQVEAVKYVSAKAQSKYLKQLVDDQFLTDDEVTIVKRARNHKSSRHPKNTDIITYKESTGFEALIGYHYLTDNMKRIKEIIEHMLGEELCIFTEKMSH